MNSFVSVNLGADNSKEGATIVVSFCNLDGQKYSEIKEVLLKYFGIDF